MRHLAHPRSLLAMAAAAGSLVAASAAHARMDVHLSIGLPVHGYVAQPAPVYVQPAPVYVQPAPVYVRPTPGHVRPAPVFVQPPWTVWPGHGHYPHGYHGHGHGHVPRRGPWGDADRDGVPNAYDRHPRLHDGNAWRAGRRDRDRDGVPNRYDRAPRNPYLY